MERPPKVRKLSANVAISEHIRTQRANFLSSLSRRVSPPVASSMIHSQQEPSRSITKENDASNDVEKQLETLEGSCDAIKQRPTMVYPASEHDQCNIRAAPIQLTRIQDLDPSDNRDTVSLSDVLSDPMISEIWIFNFCFDVDWLMQHFDQDTRHIVKVKIVHGSWKREDMNKIGIDDACKRFENVEAIQAYLPDPFGTHHSKMFIVFQHDELAQVIIHTANMLAKDWTNMTQAIWRSPLLPKRPSTTPADPGPYGSGSRFQHDLLRYLRAYGTKLKALVQQLADFDFGAVKAALVASVPSRFKVDSAEVWGHEALRRIVSHIPKQQGSPHHVFQVSSIASLPKTWLNDTLYKATGATPASTSIIFPTAEDVRVSLDGYIAGGSIHTKAQSAVHLEQIASLRPQLCRWTASTSKQAGRHLAAPHIKTYIRFASKPDSTTPAPDIDWALMTSANLSTQAWGTAAKVPPGSQRRSTAMIQIKSYEIGVLVWPGLFSYPLKDAASTEDISQDSRDVRLRPTFKCDTLANDACGDLGVAFRMPYDLPLTKYTDDEIPWSPQSSFTIPDRHGLTWPPRGW